MAENEPKNRNASIFLIVFSSSKPKDTLTPKNGGISFKHPR